MQAAAPSEFDWAVCAQTLQSQQSSLSAQGAWVLVHEVAPTYHHFAILHGSPGTEILYDVLCMPASVKLYITEYAQYSSQDGQSPAGEVVMSLGVNWAPDRRPVFSRLARSASLSLDSGYRLAAGRPRRLPTTLCRAPTSSIGRHPTNRT